jgi:hypothetical protein
MPGSSRCCGLSTVASAMKLRLVGSMAGSMAVILPVKGSLGKASLVTRTVRPVCTRASCSCGRLKSTYTGSSEDRLTTLSPVLRYWPGITVVMPRRPANGARSDFFATVAACEAAAARLFLRSAASASSCAWLMACAAYCSLSRSYTVAARSAAASSECCVATSASAFSCTSSWPALASSPERKSMLRTRPVTSVVMLTPCTARTLATAVTSGCQSE